mmetsp:Transcript_18538/g.27121  ORF Transcript_18538/g.27121 Transcript_18538/m.27121 type:complete len:138 (+) Transcript_18538:48-461(+)
MSWRAFLGRRLREVRLNLCAKSESSAGLRKYVDSHYVDIKALNPNLPFLVRAVDDVAPNVVATYDYGVKKIVDVSNFSVDKVDEVFEDLVAEADALQPKFDQLKELAEQIRVAELASLDSTELVDEFAKLRLEVEEC